MNNRNNITWRKRDLQQNSGKQKFQTSQASTRGYIRLALSSKLQTPSSSEQRFSKGEYTYGWYSASLLIMWGSRPILTVSTTVITILHSAEVVHFHVKVSKNFKPNHDVLARHNTTLPRCDCIGTLRGLSKKILYVRTGPWLSAVPQKRKLSSPAPSILKPKIHQSNTPGTTCSSSSYFAKTRAIWYCGCTIFLGGSPCSN